MSNYQFTKECENNKLMIKGIRTVITKDNLTDELAEAILSNPSFSHNIELIPGRKSEVISKKKALAGEDIELPESILLALKEAGIDETLSLNQQEKKESRPKDLKQLMAMKSRGRK